MRLTGRGRSQFGKRIMASKEQERVSNDLKLFSEGSGPCQTHGEQDRTDGNRGP